MKDVWEQLRLTLTYVWIVFTPGKKPPALPGAPPAALKVPADWRDDDYDRFIDEVRRWVDAQQADKRDVRARAQVTLTTTLVLGGAIAAGGVAHRSSPGVLIVFILDFILVGVAALASAGVVTARSDVGAVNLHNLAASDSARPRSAGVLVSSSSWLSRGAAFAKVHRAQVGGRDAETEDPARGDQWREKSR